MSKLEIEQMMKSKQSQAPEERRTRMEERRFQRQWAQMHAIERPLQNRFNPLASTERRLLLHDTFAGVK